MTTQVTPLLEHSIIKVISLGCILRLQSVDDYRSIAQTEEQDGNNTQPWIDSSPQSCGSPASKDRTSKRMSFQRLKSSKKSGTVLRAVPETTACDPALLADKRDTPTSTHQAKSCKSAPNSPALSSITENEASRGWIQHNTTNPTKHNESPKTASSIASLRGAIGTYKHGKIQWRLKDKHSLNAVKSLKPRIHVVIPSRAQDRTQPTMSTSGLPGNAQVRSASAEIEDACDMSPPTGTSKVMRRDSIVSPLNHPQAMVPVGQFQLPTPTTSSNSMLPQHRKNDSTSTTSSVDSRESDAFSLHSNHSSETSVEEDNSHMALKNTDGCSAIDADYGPPPAIPPRRYAPCVARRDVVFQPTCTLRPARCATDGYPTVGRRNSNLNRPRRSLDLHPSVGAISHALSRSESKKSDRERSTSPTLSEAESELERSLNTLADDAFIGKLADNDIQRLTPHQNSIAEPWKRHMTKPSAEPAPLLPRRSSKRQSVINAELFRLSRVPNDHIASQITRGRSIKREQGLAITIPSASHGTTGELALSPLQLPAKQEPRIISAGDAENVLYKILQSLDGLDELFATAVVSSGFYRVFKRYELDLIKSVLFKTSAPAWEFREIAFPGHDLLHDEDLEMTRPFEEYTPTSYLHFQKCDEQTLREIKTMIKEKCQSFVRPEISAALVDEKSPNAARVNDALWRIWSFCKIFGSGKGREDDVVAQQDWLKGGAQMHQQSCTFSLVSTDFMNDTLISAPDCFAKGNEGGLTAEQLFDMMELWNCLGVLLQGFQNRTADARKFGIYDNTEIRGGDIDGEEMMLDEWCHHLLSFGLSTVLALARPCDENNAVAFELARERSLTSWKPPVGGSSRRSFLKEAASRVYEDRLAHVYAESSTRELQRLVSKQRVKKYIHELKNRRDGDERLRVIRQSQDRPMSEWENVMSSLTRQHPPLPTTNDLSSHIPSFRPTSTIALEISTHIAELPAAVPVAPHAARALLPPLITNSPPRRTVAQPLIPTPPSSTISGPHDRSSIATTMPAITEHPTQAHLTHSPPQIPFPDHPAFRAQRPHAVRKDHPTSPSSRASTESDRSALHPVFQQHPAQADIFDSPAHEHTAEKAIYRIVEMGFTAGQARDALRVTDLGDGLRVDRAVELLLSRQM